MSYRKENLRQARLIIDERAQKARETADMRRNELHSRFPEIANIDSILSSTGVRIMEAASLGSQGYDARIADIRAENALLLQKRGEYLVKNGLPEDDDELKYTCPICSDSGFVNGKMCGCLETLLKQAALRDSGLSNLIGNQTFENFSLKYYDEPEKVEFVKGKCREFACAPSGNIYLCGATGLGKTHLSSAVAESALQNGYYVIYESAQKIFSDFEEVRFNKKDSSQIERYFDCDLLIIDDLGCEFRSQFSAYTLYDVINRRINSQKPMFISSNLRGSAICDAYGDRIFSRIAGEFTLLSLEGKDVRMQKKIM